MFLLGAAELNRSKGRLRLERTIIDIILHSEVFALLRFRSAIPTELVDGLI